MKYDIDLIDHHIGLVHQAVGDEPFMALGLMELEALVRSRDHDGRMPGKTLLRERLNYYRAKRWPALAPKKGSPRYW